MPADPNNIVSFDGSYFPPVLVTGTVAYYQITDLSGDTQINGLVRCSLPCTGVLVGSGSGDAPGGSTYGAPSAGMCVVDLSANTSYTLFLPAVGSESAAASTLAGISEITTTSNIANGGGPGESGATNTFGKGTGGAGGQSGPASGGYGFGAGGGGGSTDSNDPTGGGGGGFDPNAYYGITGLDVPSAKNGTTAASYAPQGLGAPSVLFLQVDLTATAPLIFTSTSTVEDLYFALESYDHTEVLTAALSGGVSDAVILLTFAEYAATNGTAIFSTYIGAYEGANATISAANAASLYTKLNITGADAAKDLHISVPDDGLLTFGPTTMNTSLAIDDTVDATYTFFGYNGHTLTVTGGVQTFTSPSGSTVLSQGSSITFTKGSSTVTYPVLHMDLTLGAGVLGGPPVCFFGDAPVKTPSGYRRIDSLKVGDRVSTPTGSAVIEVIHCQNYAAGPSANPYVIPKGRFGATQELLISPRHRVSVGGQMVEARYLGLKQKEVGTLTYYNLGLEGWADMIVAGVLVESLAPIRRITISREEFKRTMEKQGRITPEIAASHFYANHVCMPILRK
jgi:hypothetical protein